jgi:hypothetical protein
MSKVMDPQVEHDNRLRALDLFIIGYESEHGEITAAEMEAARRKLAAKDLTVSGRHQSSL